MTRSTKPLPPPPPPAAAVAAAGTGVLGFRPRATASLTAALEDCRLPGAAAPRGARLVGSSWQCWIHYNKQQTFVGRLSRHAAAVAADLIRTWQRHCLDSKTREKAAARALNLPAAGWEDDAALLQQLGRLRSPADVKTFLQALLPQEPGGGAARSKQAAAAPSPLRLSQPAAASKAAPAPRRSRRKQRSPCRAEPSDSAPPEPPEAEPASNRRRYTTPSSSAS